MLRRLVMAAAGAALLAASPAAFAGPADDPVNWRKVDAENLLQFTVNGAHESVRAREYADVFGFDGAPCVVVENFTLFEQSHDVADGSETGVELIRRVGDVDRFGCGHATKLRSCLSGVG